MWCLPIVKEGKSLGEKRKLILENYIFQVFLFFCKVIFFKWRLWHPLTPHIAGIYQNSDATLLSSHQRALQNVKLWHRRWSEAFSHGRQHFFLLIFYLFFAFFCTARQPCQFSLVSILRQHGTSATLHAFHSFCIEISIKLIIDCSGFNV